MSTPRTFAIQTLGCKLNYAESSTLSDQLIDQGWLRADDMRPPDLFVLNTCSVTEFADKKCRQAVRKIKRRNPDTKVVVTGCYAQLQPDQLAELPEVDLVLGAAEKFHLVERVSTLMYAADVERVQYADIESHHGFYPAASIHDRTRTFLKIQDGCDYSCSFCTIPLARGRSRSATIDQVMRRIDAVLETGCQEVVLTGVNIGDFGLDPSSGDRTAHFIDLLRAIDTQGVPRIRISSIEPNLCSDEMIHLIAESRSIMPHLHMPLQSGHDKMLSLMRRRYRFERYRSRVDLIHQLMPHAAIGVDVIVGFHGETEELFESGYENIKALGASYLHVFTYSERSDTHAMKMDGRVPMEVRRARSARMRELSDEMQNAHRQCHQGSLRLTLLEELPDELGRWTGYTDNYIRVHCEPDQGRPGQIVPIRIE